MYTYDNVIINPTKEGLESLVGKEVYFHNNPILCLENANEKSTDSLGVLVEVCKNSFAPFRVEQEHVVHAYTCIIEKKEEPKPEYQPFHNSREFISSFFCLDTDKEPLLQLLEVSAIWLKCKNDDIMCQVTEIWNDGVALGIDQKITSWEELLDDYVFLDERPCGKKTEESEARE